MDDNQEKLSSKISNCSTIDSIESHQNDQDKAEHGLRRNSFLMRKHNRSIKPVKPMRYVRHYTVSVSLKKSRLLRFFDFFRKV